MSSFGRNEARLARSLARIAVNDPTLTFVQFNGWGLGDEGAVRLVGALQNNTVLTVLRLRDNSISGALVRLLVGVLENSTTLRELDLSRNSFGDDGATALARFLSNNSSLNELYLSNCGIGLTGARLLAETLPSNSTLTALRLDRNNIGDEGASAFARALPRNSTLIRLDLEDNEISDAGAISLAEALPSNTSLTELYMRRNNITDAGARLLAKALLIKSSLTRIFLDISEALERLEYGLARINANAPNPQEALELKIEWLRNLNEDDLSVLGFEESGVEEEVHRLRFVCQVAWLINSEVDEEKEEAVTLVLDQLQHFPQADQRRGLFSQLLGVPELGVEVASSVDETTARTLYRYAVQCGAAPGVLMNLVRAHGSLCTCRDVEHHLLPFMLLAAMPEAEVGDVMELLLINPSLVESGISGPNEY